MKVTDRDWYLSNASLTAQRWHRNAHAGWDAFIRRISRFERIVYKTGTLSEAEQKVADIGLRRSMMPLP